MDVFPEKKRREIMSRVRNRNTRPEVLVRSLLHRLGYRFRLHRNDLPGTPDIVLPKYGTVIFVHGCFWHGHDCTRGKLPSTNQDFWHKKIEKNVVRDKKATTRLRSQGWNVINVWSCETTSTPKLNSLGHRLVRELGIVDETAD